MSLKSMMKELYETKIKKRTIVYKCPHCGSSNLGFMTSLCNYYETFALHKKPKYEHKAVCNDCGKWSMFDDLEREYRDRKEFR